MYVAGMQMESQLVLLYYVIKLTHLLAHCVKAQLDHGGNWNRESNPAD